MTRLHTAAVDAPPSSLVASYPGAVEPTRVRVVESLGIQVNVVEWGDIDADPVVLCHGFWDHARSFALLAPLLASRFRVIGMDARGHGDSGWASAYSWMTWVTDIINVIRDVGRPVFVVGHSMGGGQTTDASRAVPHLVRKLVNIDGFGPPPLDETAPPPTEQMRQYLDYRRKLSVRPGWKPYASLNDLIERRRAQNPRLSLEWLAYFIPWAARETPHGWVWKADPQMAAGAGPWKPDWVRYSYDNLRVPLLAIVGSEHDTWGPLPEAVLGPRLSRVAKLERATVAGAGHFVHIEQPRSTADLILDFFSR